MYGYKGNDNEKVLDLRCHSKVIAKLDNIFIHHEISSIKQQEAQLLLWNVLATRYFALSLRVSASSDRCQSR